MAVAPLACGGGGGAIPPTPEPTATPEPGVIIAAVGDITCGPATPPWARCRHMETAGLVSAVPDVEAVLPLGDLQYEDGTLRDFQNVYDRGWGRFKAISRPVAGNHEYLTPRAAGYFDYWNGPGVASGPAGERGQGYYSYRLGEWRMIALDSNCEHVRGGCGPGSPQERFLRDELARATEPCTLAYWHHPRWSSGPSGDLPAYDAFWRALYEGGADVVLVAHDHLYERFHPMAPDGARDETRGLRQFTVGTGGHSLYRFNPPHPQSVVRFSDEYGVLFLRLRPRSYEWKFETIDRRPGGADQGFGRCH